MIANYGYKDGSGEYIITVDTDKCDGCGDCVKACSYEVLEIIEDPYEILEDKNVVAVTDAHRKKLKYTCSPCKPVSGRKELPCVAACKSEAISHSW